MSMDFWYGKRVLLTGHTGFKGTWMNLLLEHLGAIVCGYSLPVNPYSFYSKVCPQIELHGEGDIADSEKVLCTVQKFKPEIVLHFASHSSLNGSMEIPDFILRTNLMGVVNVLEAVRKTDSVKAVVIVTSDKCYQNMETEVPYTEEGSLGATDPYGTSKVCQELLASCYQHTFFQADGRMVSIATARASNVIGAGDYNITRLMPYLLDRFSNGKAAQIRNPRAIRPWQYVLDVLTGYLLLAEKLYTSYGVTTEYNGAYNFGPLDDGLAEVGDVVEQVSQCFGGAEYVIKSGQDHIKKEASILRLDSSKAQNTLGWIPQKTLEEMIRLTVEFVKSEKQGIPAKQLAREYVNIYFEEVE